MTMKQLFGLAMLVVPAIFFMVLLYRDHGRRAVITVGGITIVMSAWVLMASWLMAE